MSLHNNKRNQKLNTSFLEIDLRLIQKNFCTLNKYVGKSICAATVKANAYGLGLDLISKSLYECGCKCFFVSDLDEGISLRKNIPDQNITIYVLNGLTPNSFKEYKNHNLQPVIGCHEELNELIENGIMSSNYPIAIHFDTGFSRLGWDCSKARDLSDQQIKPSLVMSHLACADNLESNMPEKQLKKFMNVVPYFKNTKYSIANTAGISRNKQFHLDMVRPGIGLYGGYSTKYIDVDLHQTIKLYAPVIQTKLIKKGATIGYEASYTAKNNTNIALVSIGYADGILRTLGSTNDRMGGCFYYNDSPLKILGKVSMDIVAIDISNIKDKYISRGDFVEIIGPNQNIDQLSKNADTISYELITRLNPRIKKIYKYADNPK
tara:strand:- start:3269 stop:4402 length:1134 start_codon:yes stop_codon:yes gene_type:complete